MPRFAAGRRLKVYLARRLREPAPLDVPGHWVAPDPNRVHARFWRGGLPTISQGLCGAVTPRDSVALCLEGSVVLVPSTAPRRGAPLRCAPFGVTSTARGALPRGRSGWRDGRRGRTKGWDQGQAASATAARCGLKGVWVLSMAQATARRRSATLRKARPWL